jgi:GDP-4-dehydro-6-deoxy-D-mannose reductase
VGNPVVLVTGAAGFAGGHLLEHLAGSADLVGWSPSEPAPTLAPLARWQRVDVLDGAQVHDALRELKPQAIFHLAGLPHVAESWNDTAASLAANVLGTHRILDSVDQLGYSCRILVTGSAQVYAPSSAPISEHDPIAPSNPYALSKLAQEQLALRAGTARMEVIVTRSFNPTGPRQKPTFLAPSVAWQIALIERGAMSPVIKVGNLDPSRDVMDVRDTVRAYAALMKSGAPGSVYNVASGVARPVRTIVDALLARARVPIRVEQDPSRVRPNDVPVLVGNASRLTEATGWTPQISFEWMIDDLLDFWRKKTET